MEIETALASIRRSMSFYGYVEKDASLDENPLDSGKKSAELAVMDLTGVNRVAPQDELGIFLNRKRPKVTAEGFWARQDDLPSLTKVAHDYLGIVPSSAATERTFSCSGRIESLKRLRLADSSLEASVMVAMNAHSLMGARDITELIDAACSRSNFEKEVEEDA